MKLFLKLIFTIVIAAFLVLFVISYEPNSVGGPIEKKRVYEDEIVAEQALKQEYVQILEGNKLPDDAKYSLSTQLPENVSIEVYKGPKGEGYAIITKEPNQIISVGIGAYAEENTWIKPIEILATSTIKI